LDLPSFDMEHSHILENLPIFFIFGLIGLTLIPQIPTSWKGPLMIMGIPLTLGMMYGVDKIALVQAAENTVIKARIYGWNLEKEFHCKSRTGPIQSTFNPSTGKYITPFHLAVPVSLPMFGEVASIEIEHALTWTKRNKPDHSWVHYKGIEVKHANTIMVTLYPPDRAPHIDQLDIVPRFKLAEGNQDIFLRRNRPREDLASATQMEALTAK
jgi:hypothetical protein